MEYSRPDYTLKEAAGLINCRIDTLKRRFDEVFGAEKWFTRNGRYISIPRGVLIRYRDREGRYCPGCWRPLSSPDEIVKKDVWNSLNTRKRSSKPLLPDMTPRRRVPSSYSAQIRWRKRSERT